MLMVVIMVTSQCGLWWNCGVSMVVILVRGVPIPNFLPMPITPYFSFY